MNAGECVCNNNAVGKNGRRKQLLSNVKRQIYVTIMLMVSPRVRTTKRSVRGDSPLLTVRGAANCGEAGSCH